MNDPSWGIIPRIIESMGAAGLLIFVLYRLMDKWAGKFLDALVAQATAMTDLAASVKESGDAGKEVLLALRVLSSKQEETKEWVKEMVGRK